MEDLRTINSELQTVLNLSIASTSSEDLSFPQEGTTRSKFAWVLLLAFCLSERP